MGPRKKEKVRGLIEGVSPGPWRIGLDQNAQANIYDSEGGWVALLPHQCVAALEHQAMRNAEFIVTMRSNAAVMLNHVERADSRIEPLERESKKWKAHYEAQLEENKRLRAELKRGGA